MITVEAINVGFYGEHLRRPGVKPYCVFEIKDMSEFSDKWMIVKDAPIEVVDDVKPLKKDDLIAKAQDLGLSEGIDLTKLKKSELVALIEENS